MNTDKPPLVVIAGPTASGKSALAMALSRLTPATIVNADASQLYRDLRALTARPSPADEAEVPHRLFGIIDGADAMSAADWAALAKAAIDEAHRAGRLPILVGGTGLYIRTLLDGIAPVPPIRPEVRAQVRVLDPEEARKLLGEHDPARAATLAANDRARIARSLEVVLSTGKPLAEWQAERVGGIADAVRTDGVVPLPPRDWLRARCDARFDAMLAEGAEAEVEALLARGLPTSAPVMKAIGVPQIAAMRDAPDRREALIAEAKAATRQYAKRQYTWLRHQPPGAWERIEAQLDDDEMPRIATKLREKLLTR